MTFYLVPIVEGHTEAACVERLLHRVWNELLCATDRLQVLPASRGNRNALIDPEHPTFAAKIEEAFAKLAQRLSRDPSGQGMLLLLLDAEADCPAELAPRLLETATKVRSDACIACVMPKRMLENWIVAGASSLAGTNDLPEQLPTRSKFEDHSGASWLDDQLRAKNKARKYKKPVDAKEFIHRMALQECHDNAPSFRKLCRDLAAYLPHSPAPPEAAD